MHVRSTLKIAAFAAAALLPLASHADPIAGLFDTGVDATGAALAGGAVDPHYTVFDGTTALGSAVVVAGLPGTYVPNSATSTWIWQQANGQPTNVTRTFELQFDLTAAQAGSASLSGLWGTDNYGLDIRINGQSTGQTSPGFSSLTSFAVTSGFVAGHNTLDFVVQDVGVVSAFRVEGLAGTVSAVPEPAGVALLLAGLALVGVKARGNRARG